MSYIPALHRRTGYVVTLPPRSTGPRLSALDLARQAYLRELHALAIETPDMAVLEAEGTHNAVGQLLQLASHAQGSPAP